MTIQEKYENLSVQVQQMLEQQNPAGDWKVLIDRAPFQYYITNGGIRYGYQGCNLIGRFSSEKEAEKFRSLHRSMLIANMELEGRW